MCDIRISTALQLPNDRAGREEEREKEREKYNKREERAISLSMGTFSLSNGEKGREKGFYYLISLFREVKPDPIL